MNTRVIFCILFSLLLNACGDSPNTGGNTVNSSSDDNTATLVVRERSRALTEDYAYFRKSQITDVAYTLSVQLAADSDLFTGQVSIDFNLAEGNVSPVTVDYDSGDILAVTVNDEPAIYDYDRWFLSLAAEQFSSGANNISIAYRRPYATDGAGLHKFTDPENGEIYLYTNFEPYDANRLFPHFDQPNLRAPMTLDVLAPADWQVIANTRESQVIEQNDLRHWRFPASAPISSYIYALHAGPFTSWEANAGDIPLRLFARNAIASYVKPDDWFVPTQQSFEFFQSYFDVSYPFGKYDQVIVPDFNADAMENVGAVTFNERYVSRGEKSVAQRRSLANTIAHEMAHMWFGDLVTMDWWNGLWLNESFATYMANLELEQASDFENTWDAFYSGTKQWAYATDQLVTTHPIELDVDTTADAFTNFDGITYGKGASVLKQLPYFLGEENFRQGVSNYLKKYAYQNTSLDDFVSELGLAADMNLDQWQQEWLYQSGVNTIRAEFSCQNNSLSALTLLQSPPEVSTADEVLRQQRTQVGLYRYTDGEMLLSAAIPVTYSGASTAITEAIGQPCPDLVFPNEGDWAYMKIQLDETSQATLFDHINRFPDPTTRIMLWQSLWDSVQDQAIPATRFVDFAINNIGAETDENIVRQVAGNLESAFSLFSRIEGNADLRTDYKQQIEGFILTQLESAEPGSEHQKIWFDAFTGRAHSDEALDYLLSLLQGESTLDGLDIDQDKRWSILITLNRYQHGNHDDLLQTESVRDSSDQGQNMALAAEAIRPNSTVKTRWLDIVINEPETYKLATLRTVMAYLFPAEQDVFEEQYAQRMISEIPRINETASQEYMGEYVNHMIPATCTPQSVERLSAAVEAFTGFQPLIVKAYQIAHQQDQRCVSIGEALP